MRLVHTASTNKAMAKDFLYGLCGKKKTQPVYTENPSRMGKFNFQVQVNGFDYTGFGSASNKKEAKANAAKDFVGFLIGAGFIPADSVPDEILANYQNTAIGASMPPNQEQYTPRSYSRLYYSRLYNKRSFEEAEAVDLNAHLHGNWTLANSKSKLHQYLQQNRLPVEFKYSTVGPDHNRSFKAELSVLIKSHRKTIRGTGTASTKKQAESSCCLSLVRQLFHIGVIEAAAYKEGQLRAKRKRSR